MALVLWKPNNTPFAIFDQPFRDFVFFDQHVRIFQKPEETIKSHGTIPHTVWSSAFVLCRFFEYTEHLDRFRAKYADELKELEGIDEQHFKEKNECINFYEKSLIEESDDDKLCKLKSLDKVFRKKKILEIGSVCVFFPLFLNLFFSN